MRSTVWEVLKAVGQELLLVRKEINLAMGMEELFQRDAINGF